MSKGVRDMKVCLLGKDKNPDIKLREVMSNSEWTQLVTYLAGSPLVLVHIVGMCLHNLGCTITQAVSY
jgi:hypothetical protein